VIICNCIQINYINHYTFILILMLKYIEMCLNLANTMKIFVETNTTHTMKRGE
jgi:hypothetical protein